MEDLHRQHESQKATSLTLQLTLSQVALPLASLAASAEQMDYLTVLDHVYCPGNGSDRNHFDTTDQTTKSVVETLGWPELSYFWHSKDSFADDNLREDDDGL